VIWRSEANLAATKRDVHPIAGKKPKDWMTSGEVARALNMTDAAIRRWAREGLVEAIKTPGGQYRFRREALARLLQVKRHNGPSSNPPERRRLKS
jgi:excisionase family DNA binding protein